MIYHVSPNHAFRLSSSVAYRPPTTFDVGQHLITVLTPPGLPPTRIATLGSGSVKPEQIISHELGYQGWWWDHRVRTRLTGFYNHISDLIAFPTFPGNSSDPISPVNGGVADVYGGEAGLEVLVTSWLSGFANYAYQEVGQSSNGSARRGFPHHKVNAGLRMTWHPFTGELLYHHVGVASYPLSELFTNLAPFFPAGTILPQERVPSYNLLNLRLGYTLWRQRIPHLARTDRRQRPRGGACPLRIQCAERQSSRTSLGRPARHQGPGMAHGETMKRTCQLVSIRDTRRGKLS